MAVGMTERRDIVAAEPIDVTSFHLRSARDVALVGAWRASVVDTVVRFASNVYERNVGVRRAGPGSRLRGARPRAGRRYKAAVDLTRSSLLTLRFDCDCPRYAVTHTAVN